MDDEVAYTPQRIRSFAALVYRVAAGNLQLREVGNYLARCAEAADEQGDLLQQRDAMREELGRLQQATAEAEKYRLRVLQLERDLGDALKVASAARVAARQERESRAKLEDEVRGSRLWWERARLLVQEAAPLRPPDKAALIEPMRAARVAASDRDRLAVAERLLRQCHERLTLLAANDHNHAAGDLAASIQSHLEARP